MKENLEKKVLARTKELTDIMNRLQYRNHIMESELEMARKIQMNMIPDKSPLTNMAFYYKPIEKVGGDFYDFIDFNSSDKIGIFISDVSGHGVPAAFITTMIKSAIHQMKPIMGDPSAFLQYLNDFLILQTNGNFVTAFYCIYNTKTRELVYSNAGHNSPFVIKNNQYEFLSFQNRGIPLAVLNNEYLRSTQKLYTNQSIKLEKNNKLFLYTDGLLETVNLSEKMLNERAIDFEEACLAGVFKALYPVNCLEFVYQMYERLVTFRGSNSFDDDVCMICLDVK
jgi:sigma-B regulation protein RsbU (phosphoserine phosphatase)